MKKLALLVLLGAGVFFFFKSCIRPAPVQEITDTAAKMDRARASAEEKARVSDRGVYQRAVDNFKTNEDRLPESFQEMKDKGYIGDVPSDLSYDPETGVVSSKP